MKKFSRINSFDSALFDSFRGASALLVLIGHLYQFIIAPSYQLNTESNVLSFMFSQMAVLSVMVFFVLSGFMITASMYRNISAHNFKFFDVNTFVRDRLIRLYPPLIFALALIVLFIFVATLFDLRALSSLSNGNELYLVREKLELQPANIVASLFFIQNFFDELATPSMNSPLWSLSHEFWFYVLAALALLSCYKKRYITPLLILLVVAVLSDKKVMFLAGFCIWLSGACMALLYFNNKLSSAKMRSLLLLAFLLVLGVYCFFVANRSSHLFLNGGKFVFGLLFTLFITLLISFRLHHKEGFLKNKLMQFLKNAAKYSYTLYLIHAPILLFSLAIFHDVILFNPIYYLSLSLLLSIFIVTLSRYLANYLENKSFIVNFFHVK
jgi:peptidoglycan/LPS O-acetylase OafA/YrhL